LDISYLGDYTLLRRSYKIPFRKRVAAIGTACGVWISFVTLPGYSPPKQEDVA